MQRYYLTKYCDESDDRFEILVKLVYGTLDDNCNNIAFAFVKFSFTIYRKHEKWLQIFDK